MLISHWLTNRNFRFDTYYSAPTTCVTNGKKSHALHETEGEECIDEQKATRSPIRSIYHILSDIELTEWEMRRVKYT